MRVELGDRLAFWGRKYISMFYRRSVVYARAGTAGGGQARRNAAAGQEQTSEYPDLLFFAAKLAASGR